ncbi:hypothetical protein AaE_015422 [Aphanomyces astaci]|uniref:Uncharacterized protein n=1 Tax=Aphanomyces astaci TaxID=112090 RepID=A0A6A4Z7L3_APHAT|nr:hypothetical protein AaE_015422 [Aphanomyces astaci]
MEVIHDITIVQLWGARPDAKVFKKPSTCTIPPYKSKDDIKGILVEPKEFALSLDAPTKRLVRSFTYTIGCSDVPPSVEDWDAFYLEVWGQSHKNRGRNGQWVVSESPEPLGFDRILVHVGDGEWFAGMESFSLSTFESVNCPPTLSPPLLHVTLLLHPLRQVRLPPPSPPQGLQQPPPVPPQSRHPLPPT